MAVTTPILRSNDHIYTKDRLVPVSFRIRDAGHTAWFLKLSLTSFRDLVSLGILTVAKNADGDSVPNRYDIMECMWALLEDLRGRGSKANTVQNLNAKIDQAKYQKLSSQTEREVIHNEMLKGTIARLEDVDTVVINSILAARSKLLSLPTFVVRQLPIEEDRHIEAVKILTEAIEQCLEDLVPPDHEAIRSLNKKLSKFTDVLATDTESTE